MCYNIVRNTTVQCKVERWGDGYEKMQMEYIKKRKWGKTVEFRSRRPALYRQSCPVFKQPQKWNDGDRNCTKRSYWLAAEAKEEGISLEQKLGSVKEFGETLALEGKEENQKERLYYFFW